MGGTSGIMNYSIIGSMLSGDAYRDHSAYSSDNTRGKFTFTLNPTVKITAILGWTDFFNQNPEASTSTGSAPTRRSCAAGPTPIPTHSTSTRKPSARPAV